MVVDPSRPDGDATAPRAAVVGVMAGEGIQIGMLLDAEAPVSVMIDPLLTVVNSRLLELEEAPLEATGRGRWVLCRVDGTALRSGQSLTEQQIYDGDRLWLRFVEDPEHRSPVVEHISTAVASTLAARFSAINPTTAIQVGIALLTAGVLLVTGILGWWRYGHESWLPAIYAGVVVVLLLATSTLMLLRADTVLDYRLADTLLVTTLPVLAVAAAAAVPGPVGAAHAALGFGVAGVAALLLLRFTGRRVALYFAVVVLALAVTVAAVLRMTLLTGAVTLLTSLLLASVFFYHTAASLVRWLAGIRLPVFPSATSQWVFETRPDLPTTVVASPDAAPVLEGPESIRQVVMHAERARGFLSGLLVALGVLVVATTVGLADPHDERRWLPLLIAALVAGFLLLRGRSFRDRGQAITVTLTAVLVVVGVVVRYIIELQTPAMLSTGVAILLGLPAAGLIAAAVVPNTVYSPLFRKLVEWVEYLCLMPIFPLGLWLMNVYEAIRYR
ncbi:type VII secretion integral membrane protein EccD [Mycobacterium koreense]|nr:type VII secretion integral membrane protein EccD [Mycolicibacillus koreensis]MCV7247877.1 type VII secretion integral membrane protein EccD [Mycolicibacillus koreensis]ODR03973.1 type VII secretion integral membrane protein EccD [Mycolicibacillus koreensis]BBY52983.1 type VII secretion integral membrane protein EccD [Mycolicibacillus koreensis]